MKLTEQQIEERYEAKRLQFLEDFLTENEDFLNGEGEFKFPDLSGMGIDLSIDASLIFTVLAYESDKINTGSSIFTELGADDSLLNVINKYTDKRMSVEELYEGLMDLLDKDLICTRITQLKFAESDTEGMLPHIEYCLHFYKFI